MENIAKKILVVDDSALMRRVLCDIINSDKRFQVVAKATDGLEAFDLLSRNQYDGVVLDVNMPRMTGIELLKELKKYKISANIMMASTDTKEGATTTLEALELGAMDFIHKPDRSIDCRGELFVSQFLDTLYAVTCGKPIVVTEKHSDRHNDIVSFVSKHPVKSGKKIVAIASSTGGPKALQSVIPKLPTSLDAPVIVVQHMPKGFTASFAERLDSMSELKVVEAKEGDVLENGCVYISMGGMHFNVVAKGGNKVIHYTDEPTREGVKPCANYMYESLGCLDYDQVICVVLTGMGADGTEGIKNLKKQKKLHVITQSQDTCVVYGMPKCVDKAGLSNEQVPLENMAEEIVLQVGLKTK